MGRPRAVGRGDLLTSIGLFFVAQYLSGGLARPAASRRGGPHGRADGRHPPQIQASVEDDVVERLGGRRVRLPVVRRGCSSRDLRPPRRLLRTSRSSGRLLRIHGHRLPSGSGRPSPTSRASASIGTPVDSLFHHRDPPTHPARQGHRREPAQPLAGVSAARPVVVHLLLLSTAIWTLLPNGPRLITANAMAIYPWSIMPPLVWLLLPMFMAPPGCVKCRQRCHDVDQATCAECARMRRPKAVIRVDVDLRHLPMSLGLWGASSPFRSSSGSPCSASSKPMQPRSSPRSVPRRGTSWTSIRRR